jgi:hypothetical protein
VEPALLGLDEHVALLPQARGHRGKLVPQPNLGNNRLGNAVESYFCLMYNDSILAFIRR